MYVFTLSCFIQIVQLKSVIQRQFIRIEASPFLTVFGKSLLRHDKVKKSDAK
jgi:hypothetical protein